MVSEMRVGLHFLKYIILVLISSCHFRERIWYQHLWAEFQKVWALHCGRH